MWIQSCQIKPHDLFIYSAVIFHYKFIQYVTIKKGICQQLTIKASLFYYDPLHIKVLT